MSLPICGIEPTHMHPSNLYETCHAECTSHQWGNMEFFFWIGGLQIGIAAGVKVLPYIVKKTADYMQTNWLSPETAKSFKKVSNDVSRHVYTVGSTIFITGAVQKYTLPTLIDTTCATLCAKTTEACILYKA